MSNTDHNAEMDSAITAVRDKLIAKNDNNNHDDGLKHATLSLENISKPIETMNMLASFLFLNPSNESNMLLSSSDALQILLYLVTSDPNKYLKVASRAVKDEAIRVSTDMSEVEMYVSSELLSVLVSSLSTGKDVEASQNAMDTLVATCKTIGPDYTQTVIQVITEVWKQSIKHMKTNSNNIIEASTSCVRCATAIVEITIIQETAMKVAIDNSSYSLFIDMLTDDTDPLLQMSFLDLLEKLTISKPMHHIRAQWLFSESVIKPILHMAGGMDNVEPDPILGGPAIRIVSGLCKIGQEYGGDIFGVYDENLLKSFHHALHNFEISGESDRLAIIDAISSFATSSSTALDLVISDPITRDGWLSLSVAKPKMKAAILISIAMVLNPRSNISNNEDDNNVTLTSSSSHRITNEMGMKLFATLGRVNGNEETSELLISLAKSPFPETRLGAYAVLEAVAKLPTGGQVLFTNGSFYEFLMNREQETTKEGKEAKYSLVQAIVASPVKGLLADDIVRELDKYISQGPYYKKVLNWEVAEQ